MKFTKNKSQPGKKKKTQSVLKLTHSEARAFFLKPESYSNVDLPDYFQFESVLKSVEKQLQGKTLKNLSKSPRDFENVNHSLLSNKDGRHAWRPFQFIHPALYVSLVSKITEKKQWETIRARFSSFSELDNFKCLSIPVSSGDRKKSDKAAQIIQWWSGIEQFSISLALDYNYVFQADISDCYSSIYTHSIAWAVHGRDEAKRNRDDETLIGNLVDWHIQDMRHGQTNGIPQGSVLMDFVAELLLGFSDLLLQERLPSGEDYKILRYRDDYRIFVNSPSAGERILKCLTEVLIELGLKLNTAKTTGGQPVVFSSIKADKRAFLLGKQGNRDLGKHLLLLHAHGERFPNAGSLTTALSKFHQRILKIKTIRDPIPLISIALDIACTSPRTFPFCAAIISKLLSHLFSVKERIETIQKIHTKLMQLPNVGQLEIWLQRISYPHNDSIKFDEPLCRLVNDDKVNIWNSDWITSKALKGALNSAGIIDKKKLGAMKPIIQPDEVDLFSFDY